MHFVNRLVNAVSDLFFRLWSADSLWPALIAGSIVVAAIMVGLFHVSSNQIVLRNSRNRMVARTLELLLFRHDARVSLTACRRILTANLYYLAAFARPMAVAIVPMIFIFSQFAAWFEWRPLQPSETVVVEIALHADHDVLETPVQIDLADSLQLEGPGVRVPIANEISYRIRAKDAGDAWIDIRVGETLERKELRVGGSFVKLSPRRSEHDFWQQLLYPVEPPLPRESPVSRIDIRYPPRELYVGDIEVHWLVASIVLMMAGGLAIGKATGVSIA